ncbi:hypothetical protein ANCCAN_24805 [Ancylostoma caninum]|uniref:Leucine Rich repeat-containing domain protein n=1 Tax=Ancylostoma caninum TaxID=29170 RepID=A0A368FBB1_ANCCA|nr:hypothetical protein ANCCAN_24805 [Ancylostoma caninum]
MFKCSTFIFRILPSIVIQSRNTLVHLIADGNLLNENSFNMPIFPRLRTLSIDVNRVRDVFALLRNLRRCCPQLTSISLIGNPGWCPSVCPRNQQLSKKYRAAALSMLPHLHSIDAKSTRVFRRNSRMSISSCASHSTLSTNTQESQ